MSTEEETRIQYVRGLPVPMVPWFKKENIEDSMDYTPRDGDIIVASYPKTGTTWLQNIVCQILYRGKEIFNFDELMYHRMPYMEVTGIAVVEKLEDPRSYKHHLPYNMVKKNDKAKYLYIYRNTEDVLVSFYHFMNALQKRVIPFESFFEEFLSGEVGYGNYFDHVLSYWAHKDDPGLLLVSYEKLHRDRRTEVLRIAEFLGKKHFEELQEDDSIMDRILEHISFDFMKKNMPLEHPGDKILKAEGKMEGDVNETKDMGFFRKGIVGDGKNAMSEEQRQRLRDAMLEKIQDADLLKELSN